jgi:hypothetical protein
MGEWKERQETGKEGNQPNLSFTLLYFKKILVKK